MRIMKEEIFGPILPIYGIAVKLTMLLTLLIADPRPLALLHYFALIRRDPTMSHSIRIQGISGKTRYWTHVAQDDLPFGGVGASGMGTIVSWSRRFLQFV